MSSLIVKSFNTIRFNLESRLALFSLFAILSQFQITARNANLTHTANWLLPLNILSPIDVQKFWFLFGLIIFGFLLTLIPRKPIQVWIPLLWLTSIALNNSYGKISHSQHGFFFASLGTSIGLFLFLPRRGRLNLIFAGAVLPYLSAGLWKARGLLASGSFWTDAKMNLPHYMAYGIAEGSKINLSLFQFISDAPTLAGILWVSVIAFQIFGPMIGLFNSRYRIVILLGFIFFHIGAYATVGPLFESQIILLGFLIFEHLKLHFDDDKAEVKGL